MKRKYIYINLKIISVEKFLAAIFSLTLVAVIFMQVICRYILYISTPWAEELARYSFIGLAYMGAGVGVYYSLFTNIDLVDKIFDGVFKNVEKAEKGKLIVEKLCLVIMTFVLVYFGVVLWNYLSHVGSLGQRSTAMRLNMLFPMSTLFVGTVFMLIHAVCCIICSKQEMAEVQQEIADKRKSRKSLRKGGKSA